MIHPCFSICIAEQVSDITLMHWRPAPIQISDGLRCLEYLRGNFPLETFPRNGCLFKIFSSFCIAHPKSLLLNCKEMTDLVRCRTGCRLVRKKLFLRSSLEELASFVSLDADLPNMLGSLDVCADETVHVYQRQAVLQSNAGRRQAFLHSSISCTQ